MWLVGTCQGTTQAWIQRRCQLTLARSDVLRFISWVSEPGGCSVRAPRFPCGEKRTFQKDHHRHHDRLARQKPLLSKRHVAACLQFAEKHLVIKLWDVTSSGLMRQRLNSVVSKPGAQTWVWLNVSSREGERFENALNKGCSCLCTCVGTCLSFLIHLAKNYKEAVGMILCPMSKIVNKTKKNVRLLAKELMYTAVAFKTRPASEMKSHLRNASLNFIFNI